MATINKTQGMRPAEIDVIDYINGDLQDQLTSITKTIDSIHPAKYHVHRQQVPKSALVDGAYSAAFDDADKTDFYPDTRNKYVQAFSMITVNGGGAAADVYKHLTTYSYNTRVVSRDGVTHWMANFGFAVDDVSLDDVTTFSFETVMIYLEDE